MLDVHYTIGNQILRRLLRFGMGAIFSALRLRWRLTRPETRGASAFCVTPDGRIVLVYSTYEQGWNLPGGGIAAGESAQKAVLRELREELSLSGHAEVIFAFEMHHEPNFKRDTESVFLITEAIIGPASIFEIERVGFFLPEALPVDISAELRNRLSIIARQKTTYHHPALRHFAERLPLMNRQ